MRLNKATEEQQSTIKKILYLMLSKYAQKSIIFTNITITKLEKHP